MGNESHIYPAVSSQLEKYEMFSSHNAVHNGIEHCVGFRVLFVYVSFLCFFVLLSDLLFESQFI